MVATTADVVADPVLALPPPPPVAVTVIVVVEVVGAAVVVAEELLLLLVVAEERVEALTVDVVVLAVVEEEEEEEEEDEEEEVALAVMVAFAVVETAADEEEVVVVVPAPVPAPPPAAPPAAGRSEQRRATPLTGGVHIKVAISALNIGLAWVIVDKAFSFAAIAVAQLCAVCALIVPAGTKAPTCISTDPAGTIAGLVTFAYARIPPLVNVLIPVIWMAIAGPPGVYVVVAGVRVMPPPAACGLPCFVAMKAALMMQRGAPLGRARAAGARAAKTAAAAAARTARRELAARRPRRCEGGGSAVAAAAAAGLGISATTTGGWVETTA
ncbi:hypothetical protein DFJ73DRAFT_960797 [Zopfochytrium polystomum]|nr:hypothetical protein DFJ73DRAFT_960797 [Zopfochytrium polystomum]